MDDHRLLARLARGQVGNVRFAQICRLAEGLGFELRRVSGSHHIFAHPRLVERYDLKLEGES